MDMAPLRSRFRKRIQEYINQPNKLLVFAIGNYALCTIAYALFEKKGFLESVWWTVVTGFTVGYGDVYPTSVIGRCIALVVMFTSWFILSVMLVHIINDNMENRDLFSHEEQELIKGLLGSLVVQAQLIYQLIVDNHRAKMAILIRIEDAQTEANERQEAFNQRLAKHLGIPTTDLTKQI